jgi:predicted metal-dependent phosphoesterase TrpH
MLTYRQVLQQLIEEIDSKRDNLEGLRYKTNEEHKVFINNARYHLGNAIMELGKLDNRLSDGEARREF